MAADANVKSERGGNASDTSSLQNPLGGEEGGKKKQNNETFFALGHLVINHGELITHFSLLKISATH